QVGEPAPEYRLALAYHGNGAVADRQGFAARRIGAGQLLEQDGQRAGLTGFGNPVALLRSARMQTVILATVHADNLHVTVDGLHGGKKTLAVVALGIQLVRGLI